MYDFNNDGFLEIILPTSAPNNGNIVDDTSDNKSYLICLDHLGQRLGIRQFGDVYSRIKIKLADMDGDGKNELISLFSYWTDSNIQPYIEIIDPLNDGNPVIPRRELPLKETDFEIIQTDRDIKKEIIVADNTGEILLLDNSLNILREKILNFAPGEIYVCEDLNNDGFKEILISGGEGTIWMDHNLSILAKISIPLSSRIHDVQLCHREGKSPLILLKDNKIEKLYTIKKAPFYLFSYYGPSLGMFIVFSLILGLITFSIVAKNQKSYWHKMFESYTATINQPVFIFDQNLFLLYVNSAGNAFLNIRPKKLPHSIENQNKETKLLIKNISFLKNAEAISHQREFTFANNKIIRFMALPIQISGFPKAYWLVVFQDSAEKEFIQQAKTWSAMAQRIAHDIKNPLTSIQLSLQRLQMEYQKQDKKHIKDYDKYTDRILERIEFLKRQTRDFMKFVNLEKLNLQPANLNEIIKNIFNTSMVEIPNDITLIKKLSNDIPNIHLDQE